MRRAGVVAGGAGLGLLLVLVMGLVIVGSDENGSSGLQGVVCAPPGGTPGDPIGEFSGVQLVNASKIVAAGVEMGAPERAQLIALATAMQESRLLMYANKTVPESLEKPHDRVGRDHDSVGVFQQRGVGWGSLDERMDVAASARLFYRALLALPDWNDMPVTVAAQTVQRSAFPEAYAQWEQPAREILGSLAGITCTGGPGDSGDLPTNSLAQPLMDRAVSQIGVNYEWGGGSATGPTGGGFDCSGLMVYAFAGIGVDVPHQTQAIWAAFQPAITDPAQVQPGDMILLTSNGSPSGIDHVALYLGEGRVVHAPQTGEQVKIVEDVWNAPYWSQRFIGAVRALPTSDSRS